MQVRGTPFLDLADFANLAAILQLVFATCSERPLYGRHSSAQPICTSYAHLQGSVQFYCVHMTTGVQGM